jgi:hypothetical protein
MATLADVEDEMRRIVVEAQKEKIFMRLIGGLAIKVHCPSAGHRSLEREYPDIDLITDKAGARKLAEFLPAMGYVPNKTFNTLSGDRRQLYYDEERARQIDIFIGEFQMSHKLPLAGRLSVEPLTVPLAELFLTKGQIVHLNRKDVLDMLALVLDHEPGHGDTETINIDRIAELCAQDWGLYTTISINIQKILGFLADATVDLDEAQAQRARERLAAIQAAMEAAPKPTAWKIRARIGTRVRWYEEVEEVRR